MTYELIDAQTVNGQQYRTIDVIDDIDGDILDTFSEVKTTHCGWKDSDYICNRACDVECKGAHNLFDEIGIEY